MTNLAIEFDDAPMPGIVVDQFDVRARMSELGELEVLTKSTDPNLDLHALVGRAVTVKLPGGTDLTMRGIVRKVRIESVEPTGLSLYRLFVVPSLHLLT